jgi:hypothetical protein
MPPLFRVRARGSDMFAMSHGGIYIIYVISHPKQEMETINPIIAIPARTDCHNGS